MAGLSPLEASWEDVAYMKKEFPYFNLEDKVVVNGRGIDMNRELDGAEIGEDQQGRFRRKKREF